MRLQLAASSLVLVLAGCAAELPLPMTAGELMARESGRALVAYLGQPDASPAVCDLRASGPHIQVFSPEVRGALVAGLVDGKINPALWRRCVDAGPYRRDRRNGASRVRAGRR